MPTKEQRAEYRLIVRTIRASGACQGGMEYVEGFRDFDTMFYNIPRIDWLAWLFSVFQRAYLEAVSDAGVKNAIMLLARERRSYMIATLGGGEKATAHVDSVIEGPWTTTHTDRACNLYRASIRAPRHERYTRTALYSIATKNLPRTLDCIRPHPERCVWPKDSWVIQKMRTVVLPNFDNEPLRQSILAYAERFRLR